MGWLNVIGSYHRWGSDLKYIFSPSIPSIQVTYIMLAGGYIVTRWKQFIADTLSGPVLKSSHSALLQLQTWSWTERLSCVELASRSVTSLQCKLLKLLKPSFIKWRSEEFLLITRGFHREVEKRFAKQFPDACGMLASLLFRPSARGQPYSTQRYKVEPSGLPPSGPNWCPTGQ